MFVLQCVNQQAVQNTMDNLAIEYCALTLAIILVWHPMRIPLDGGKWSASISADEMKLNEYGDSSNLTVNPFALHQGFHIFKKSIRSHGHELIQMGCKRDVPLIPSFMGLPDVFNGWNIIFAPSKRRSIDLSEVESMIKIKARAIVKRHSGGVLRFSSLNEIGAFIYQSQLPVAPALPVPEILVVDPGPNSNKRRKCSDELGKKQLRNCGKEVLSIIKRTLCIKNEDATPYLLAALQESRSLRALDCIKRSIFGSASKDDENVELYSISDDVRVKQSIALLPKRNIIFADEEKDHVLRIRDVISTVIKELPDDHVIRSDYSSAGGRPKNLKSTRRRIYPEKID